MAVDVVINEKPRYGVGDVDIPLADGTGDAKFILPQDTSWFEQVFRYVGEYDVATATNDDATLNSYVLKDCFADLCATRESLGVAANNGTFTSALIVPTAFDESQNDMVFALRGFANVPTDSDVWSYPGCGVFARNAYFGFVKSFNASYNKTNLTQNFDITKDIEIGKIAAESDWVLSAQRARLYILAYPLA